MLWSDNDGIAFIFEEMPNAGDVAVGDGEEADDARCGDLRPVAALETALTPALKEERSVLTPFFLFIWVTAAEARILEAA
jgi:hypothetical protein